jgi:hypothetical protein
MGGSKRRKRSRAKRLRANIQSAPRKLKRARRRKILKFGGLIGLAGVVIGLPSAISVLTAKVPITPLGSINPATPLTARFQVANEGSFSIYDVTPEFLLNGQWGGIVLKNNKVDIKPTWIHEIEPGSKPVTFIGRFITLTPAPFEKDDFVDVVVTISFRAKFTWWRKPITRRFFAQRNKTGEMEWVEIPVKPK